MAHSMAAAVAEHQRVKADTARPMAKAHLRKAENPAQADPHAEMRRALGGCIERAYRSLGLTLDQLAGSMDRDPRQVRRWMDGTENPQFAALFSVEALRVPLVMQMARLTDQIEVETVLRVRGGQ